MTHGQHFQLAPWPRLFQNLRAPRATELVRQFPGHVAASWLGHSEEIADDHYRMTLDSDFAKAIGEPEEKAAQIAAQHMSASGGMERKPEIPKMQNRPEIPSDAALCGSTHDVRDGPDKIRTCDLVLIRDAL